MKRTFVRSIPGSVVSPKAAPLRQGQVRKSESAIVLHPREIDEGDGRIPGGSIIDRFAAFILTILAASHSHAVVPAAPSNLHTIAIAATHVDFAWQDNSNNETQFRLQRLISGTYTTIATVGANVTTASDT